MRLRLPFAACLMTLAACQSGKPAAKPRLDQSSPAPAVVDSDLASETARSAGMKVAAMPSLNDARAQQEIMLHAALYRAAYQSNVGDFTRHFLLEPVHDSENLTPSIDRHEFNLRVLADLADLNVPMAWAGSATGSAPPVEYFPGTRERATRLRIRILQRLADQATVQAEVGDWTADVGSSRQAVTATWDGQNWAIQRDRVRLVW